MSATAALPPARALALAKAHVLDGIDPPADPAPNDPGVTFFLWRPDRIVACLGVSQSPERELHLDACRADGVDILRRASGGGAVMLVPGVLCWEAWATETTLGGESGICSAYRVLSRPVVEGLAALGFAADMAGTSDLACPAPDGGASRKIAGTAQFRRRGRVWVHGSLLVDAEVAGFSRWLREPSEAPAYRAGRDHRTFCVTLSELAGRPVLVEGVASAILASAARLGWTRLVDG